MNITAINNIAPIKNNSIISSKISETPTEQSKEINQLPSLNFCSAYASNIKMFSFDKIAEKSKYPLLRDAMYLDFVVKDKPADKVQQWKESMYPVSESLYFDETADIYNKNTIYRDGSVLREQISDNTKVFTHEDESRKVSDNAGKYQSIWYTNPNPDDGTYMFIKTVDGKPSEALYRDSRNTNFWHYMNEDKNVHVVLNTKKLNKMGYSNDTIFERVTGFNDTASYGPSLRAYIATNLSQGNPV